MDENSVLRNWMNTKFLTVPCSQMAVDFILWEHVLNKHCAGYGRILELGTLRAGFSLFLCCQAIQRNMDFRTFDNYDFNAYAEKAKDSDAPYGFNTPLGKLLLQGRFVEEDVLHDGETLKELINLPGQTILFCDNGCKPMEVLRYAPLLKPNDILAVHDWGTEIVQADIPEGLTPIEEELTVTLQGMTAFFKR